MAFSTSNLLNAPNIILNLLFVLTQIWATLVCVNSISLVIVLHAHSRTRFSFDLLNWLVDWLFINEFISIICSVIGATRSLVLWFFAYVVISLIKRFCGSYNILTSSSKALRVVATILIVLWLNNNTLRSLGSMGWVS